MKASFLIVVGLAAGCASDPTPGPGGSCTPGDVATCSCSTGSGTQTCEDTGDFGACACPDPDPDPTRVNFRAQVVPIFARSCGTGSTGCHERAQYAATLNMGCRGWLTLEDASLGAQIYGGPRAGEPTDCPDRTLYERLLELAPWQCGADSRYVVPGDPAASYLVDKIEGTDLCEASPGVPSEAMPPATSTFRLSDADKQLIRQWIAEGAVDN
ncbi:MAG TPA: hypothetical protein VFQ53_32555 [Kofleriaceae bacterium]|nr:hypothetical protein [Kofleriaceae bacterium]